jgi:hypothetical protein
MIEGPFDRRVFLRRPVKKCSVQSAWELVQDSGLSIGERCGLTVSWLVFDGEILEHRALFFFTQIPLQGC